MLIATGPDNNPIEVQADANGNLKTSISGSLAKEPFSGSANVTHTFTQPMNGFVISNDGTADLTFTIGTDTYTVKQGEVFKERFTSFTQVIITTTMAYRAYGLL